MIFLGKKVGCPGTKEGFAVGLKDGGIEGVPEGAKVVIGAGVGRREIGSKVGRRDGSNVGLPSAYVGEKDGLGEGFPVG